MSSAYQKRLTFATLPRTERGRPIVLGADPKGKNFLYTHGNSVIIRDLANPEIADIYTQHSCQVSYQPRGNSGFLFLKNFLCLGQCCQIFTIRILHCICRQVWQNSYLGYHQCRACVEIWIPTYLRTHLWSGLVPRQPKTCLRWRRSRKVWPCYSCRHGNFQWRHYRTIQTCQ